jgi:hypothetical protein
MPTTYSSLLGANAPCYKIALSPFWSVKRGETPFGACLRVAPPARVSYGGQELRRRQGVFQGGVPLGRFLQTPFSGEKKRPIGFSLPAGIIIIKTPNKNPLLYQREGGLLIPDNGRGYLALDLLPGHTDQVAKGLRFPDSHVCQHLAVNLHTRLFESVYQLAVCQTLSSTGGVDPCNPQTPHVSLPLTTVSISVAQ